MRNLFCIGAVIISIVVALMGGCGRTDPFTVEQHVQRAKSMLASNQIRAAEIELKTALRLRRDISGVAGEKAIV